MCFVYLYCAFADMELMDAELRLAQSPVDEDTFKWIKDGFDNMTDQERLAVILEHKQFYDTPYEKEHLLAEMKKMFEIDNEFVPIERAVHNILARIL